MHHKYIWHICDKLSIILHDFFFSKVLLHVLDMHEIKELEDSPNNRTFASII